MKRFISNRNFAPALVFFATALLAVTAYALTTTRLATGTMAFSELVNGPADIGMSKTVMAPGENTGWHFHPGMLHVIVTRGTLTLESGCGGVETFTAGQAFTEHSTNIHRGVNYGPEDLEFYTTGIRPAGAPGRVSFDGPRCGPPTNKDQCKNGGWTTFNYPTSFVNEGDCVSFVETGK